MGVMVASRQKTEKLVGLLLAQRSRGGISGAGVLIVEDYMNEKCVTLFRDKYSRRYEEGGGKVDTEDGENTKKTASRELMEESRNMFRISEKDLTTYVEHENYRCYVVMVRGPIYGKYFYYNQIVLNGTTTTPEDWKDTDNMDRFVVDTLVKDGLKTKEGHLRSTTYEGKTVTISGRTKACIRKLYRKTNGFTKLTYTNLEHNSMFLPKPHQGDFLRGTKCYYT